MNVRQAGLPPMYRLAMALTLAAAAAGARADDTYTEMLGYLA